MALTQQDKEELYQYIISRGRGIASLPDGDSDLSNKYLGPVIEYTSGGTAGRLVRLAVSLLQGKGATMRRNGDEVQWKLQGSTDVWETLFTVSSLKGDKGENGKSPVFRKGETALEYKLEGEEDTTYKTLVALSEITGPEGDHIVLRSSNGRIEYKQSKEPDTAYRELLLMEDIRGAKGDTGPAPILELGEVTTVEPSDPASATFQPNGVDPSGANKYRLALSIPKGKSGQDGTGAGNVLVNNEASLLASKQYAFKPGQDGSVNGAFVEVEATGGAIEIPMSIMDLDTSATSEQILAVWPMEDILKVIKGKPGGVYYMHGGRNAATAYIQVMATVSEDPTVTPHDVTLSIPVIMPGGGFMQIVSYFIETDESTVSITGVVYDSIGIPVNDDGSGHYSGVLVPIKDKESGVVTFHPWYHTLYQYVIFIIDDFKTDTSAQIKEKLKGSPIIAERVDAGDTEFSALSNALYVYGIVIGITHSRSIMFMDSCIVHDSSIAMYFKGGETLYTLTISEDPTTKDLSATVVESSIGQSNHTLDLSPLFDSDGNPVSAVTDEFIAELQKAYEEKYSNCTAKVFNDVIIPLAIRKEASGYEIVLSIVSNNELGLAFVGYNFVIDTTLKTLAFTAKDAQLETTGDGSKFLSNDGTYKAISSGAGNIYHLDLDISGYMSRATEAEQTAVWGKIYTAPTSENIITLLGGAEGVRQLCEKLKPTNNPIVTVPYMLYFLPTRLLSTSVSILIADSTSLTNILSSPRDGCYINIALMFYTRINDPISIVVNLIIANFNTDTQQVSYEYLENTEFVHIEDSLNSSSTSDALSANQGRILDGRIDKKVGSEDISTIKKLTQAAYDALSSKDTKTLYACIQTNGTIIIR